MNRSLRLMKEYAALSRVLSTNDFLTLLLKTWETAPKILRSGKLTSLDTAMSHRMRVRYRQREMIFPLAEIDTLLAARSDNPTFGNLREIFARNCYLMQLDIPAPVGLVIDLGANRGIFSLLALAALDAERVIGVEPVADYDPVMRLLLEANRIPNSKVVRYNRFVTSRSFEQRDSDRNISMETIYRIHGIDRVGLLKIDIEGGERDLFSEPEWLSIVDSIAMEIHPRFADMSGIPTVLEKYGFQYRLTDQWGAPSALEKADFLFASRIGALVA